MSGTTRPAVVVLGATGTVGRGVVQAAIESSWPVLAVARDARALDELRRCYPRGSLLTLAASVADDESAAALAATLGQQRRPFAGVIAALGGGPGRRGRLLDHPTQHLKLALDEWVLPQLAAARHLLPWLSRLRRNCSYVLIGGPGGRNPWAGYGHRSVAAAALRMLARVLHDEARTLSIRLHLLEVHSPACTPANRSHACPQWPGVEAIGRQALALLERRNDARCPNAVVDFSTDAAHTGPDALTFPQDQGSPFDAWRGFDGANRNDVQMHEMSNCPSLLTERCLQDVRTLLETAFHPSNKKSGV